MKYTECDYCHKKILDATARKDLYGGVFCPDTECYENFDADAFFNRDMEVGEKS